MTQQNPPTSAQPGPEGNRRQSGRPTRETVEGRAYLDLQNLARKQRRPTDELQRIYVLEGFLDRYTRSRHVDRLVLKGGMMLAAFDLRRPTRDVDFQARQIPSDLDEVLAIVRDITMVQVDDGLIYDTDQARAEVIREDAAYNGIRITMTARLATAELTFHVDINIGDPITPAPTKTRIPRMLGGEIEVPGFPLPMVHAEKIVTAISRGNANTRWRDFADIYLLAGHQDMQAGDLRRALTVVSEYRRVELRPLRSVLARFATNGQRQWVTWRRRMQLEVMLPDRLADVLERVQDFADPIITTTIPDDATWIARQRRWRS